MDLEDKEYIEYVKGLECEKVKSHIAQRLNEGSKIFKEIKVMFAATDQNIKRLSDDVHKIKEEFTPDAYYKRWSSGMKKHREEQGNTVIWLGKLFGAAKSLAIGSVFMWVFLRDIIEAIFK